MGFPDPSCAHRVWATGNPEASPPRRLDVRKLAHGGQKKLVLFRLSDGHTDGAGSAPRTERTDADSFVAQADGKGGSVFSDVTTDEVRGSGNHAMSEC